MLPTGEDIYRRFFNTLPTMLATVDFEGRFVELNSSWEAYLGYTPAELAGKPCTDIVHPDDRDGMEENQRKILAGAPSALFEARFLCKDGAVKWLYIRCAADREKRLFYVVTTDITARKLTEEALRESERTLRGVIDNSPLPMGLQTFDGRIEYFNAKYTRAYGYTAQDTPDRAAWMAMCLPDPAYRAEISARFEAAFAVSQGSGGENIPAVPFLLTCKNGEVKNVSLVGVASGGKVLAIFEDMTDRVRAEQALRESEARLRHILDRAPMSMAIVAMDGTIEYINQKAEETFGFPHAEIPNMDRWWVQAYPDEKYRKEVIARYMGHVYEAIEKHTEIAGEEYVVTCKDGSKKTCFIFGEIIADKVFVMFDDITQRVEALKALRESESALRRILDHAPVAMGILTAGGQIEYLNEKFTQLLGYTTKDIPDFESWERAASVNDEMRAALTAQWKTDLEKSLAGGEVPAREYVARCKDGTVKTLLIRAVIIGEKIFITFDDISRRIQAEKAVRDSEAALRQILEQAPLGIVIQGLDNSFEFINHKFTEYFGYDIADIPNLAEWGRRAYPDEEYRKKLLSWQPLQIEKSRKTGTEMDPIEVEVVCKDGSKKNVSVTGVVTQGGKVVSLLEDITGRVMASSAVRNSEAALRLILSQTPISIVIHDLDGKVEFINRKFTQTYGYKPEDMPTFEGWARQAYPEEGYRKTLAAIWREWIERSLKSGLEMEGKEVRVVCKDGSAKTVYITGIVTADKKVIALLDDVTARVETERALRERESLYRALIETTGTGYVVMDGQGRVLDANREYVRLTGHSDLKEIMGRGVIEWSAPHNQKEAREAVELVIKNGRLANFELDYVNKAGRFTRVEISATVVSRAGVQQILGLVRDVSARSKTEAELRDSESLYRALVETTRTGYVVVDFKGMVLDANREYARQAGYADIKEVLGRCVTEWTAPDKVQDNAAAVAKCARDGHIFNYETDYVDRVGRRTPIEINATVVNRGGTPQIHTLCRDITERRRTAAELQALNQGLEKRVAERTAELSAANMELTMEIAQRIDAEKGREKLQQELLQSQKMEVVGRLAGGIAHDFNNILVAISGYAEFLAKTMPDGAEAKDDLNEIIKETERGAMLTRQLTTISRRQPLELKLLCVNSVVEDSCKMLKRLIGANMHLHTVLAPDLAAVKADQGQVAQVIMNLVINARDAMPNGGEITLTTANEDVAAMAEPMPLAPAPGRYVTLTVADTGSGIPPETAAHIFEPFFTTKPQGKGTGLGLSTVYGIVDQGKGGIGLKAGPGGTAFKIYLPRAAEKA